ELSPDRPVISKSACSGGSCACWLGDGTPILHLIELKGEALPLLACSSIEGETRWKDATVSVPCCKASIKSVLTNFIGLFKHSDCDVTFNICSNTPTSAVHHKLSRCRSASLRDENKSPST